MVLQIKFLNYLKNSNKLQILRKKEKERETHKIFANDFDDERT